MSSLSAPRLAIVGRILLPSMVIAVAFSMFHVFPSQRLIQSRRSELEKRQSLWDSAAKSPIKSRASMEAKLASVQAESSVVAQSLSEIERQTNSASRLMSQLVDHSMSTDSPAGTVAATLELFRRNHVVCIHSGLVSNTIPKQEQLSEKRTSVSPATATTTTDGRLKRRYRIQAVGTFQDMRSTLFDLIREQPLVIPVSIDMDEPDPLDDQREWTLILLI